MSVLKFPTPLESAVDSAFRKTFNSKLTPEGKATFMEELKRELEKAVPAKALPCSCYQDGSYGYEGCTCGNYDDARAQGASQGHNECRKLMGLE